MPDLIMMPTAHLDGEPDVAGLVIANELRDTHEVESEGDEGAVVGAMFRSHGPLGGKRTLKNERWIVAFAGDLVEAGEAPLGAVVGFLETQAWERFNDLTGNYALAAYDRVEREFHLISDLRAQLPVFYRTGADGIVASTTLASFLRLDAAREFDPRWLWESLYFNFPNSQNTFLKGVKRLPPATVLTFSARNQKLTTHRYASEFRRAEQLSQGSEALEQARNVFSRRVARYFDTTDQVACALTGGWDGRTMLALAPEGIDITAYTYGAPGCADLSGAATLAEAIRVKHIQIPFGEDFVKRLPEHGFETVYQTGGLQGVLRSTLHHAYRHLTNDGTRFPLTMSGIALDMLFRGHAHCPDLISPEMEARFRGGGTEELDNRWRAVFGSNHEGFRTHIGERSQALEDRFGPFTSSEHHLSYIVYPLSTHHFCGELALANRYTTVRVPCWDPELIELAYAIKYSTLSFSQFLAGHKRGSRAEMILQSHLFKTLAPDFYRMPVGSQRPAAVLAGDFRFEVERIYNAVMRRVRHRTVAPVAPPLEDWRRWLFDENRDFLFELLKSPDTSVTDYLEPAFVDRTLERRDLRMLGKLLTVEIILRLIKTRWQKFW